MPVLSRLARGRLARLRFESESRPSLLEWIPQLSPDFIQPTHLAPLIDCLEAIQRGETVRVVCHTPPRGGKTETLLAAIPWWLKQHPDWRIAYTSYNANQARSKARRAMELSKSCGVYRSGGVLEWLTSRGGGCIARGVGEGITGQGVDVAIVDDPVKDRVEAESALRRERAWDWFREALFTRGNPGKRPRSIIVNMARWHPDDLAGRLVKHGWRYICLPALDDSGESFWPQMWTAAQLQDTKDMLGPYSWASLYQGQPRPRGGSVFGDPHVWTALPTVYRLVRGVDLAYTAKTSADWSVLVTMAVERDIQGGPPRFYVLDVLRRQSRAPDFQRELRVAARAHPAVKMRIYGAAGPEAGAVDMLRKGIEGVPQLKHLPAVADKFVRAQPYAAAWNAARVFVPEDSAAHPWVDDFVVEHLNFTGIEDAYDDQVDAGAAAHDEGLGESDASDFRVPRSRPRHGLAGMHV